MCYVMHAYLLYISQIASNKIEIFILTIQGVSHKWIEFIVKIVSYKEESVRKN